MCNEERTYPFARKWIKSSSRMVGDEALPKTFLHCSVPWAIRAERRSSHIIPSPVSPHASRKAMSKSAPPGLPSTKLPASPAAAQELPVQGLGLREVLDG